MRDNLIIRKLLAIEGLLKAMDSQSAQDLIEENKKLKANILASNKVNGQLKGEVTKLKNKLNEVK